MVGSDHLSLASQPASQPRQPSHQPTQPASHQGGVFLEEIREGGRDSETRLFKTMLCCAKNAVNKLVDLYVKYTRVKNAQHCDKEPTIL